MFGPLGPPQEEVRKPKGLKEDSGPGPAEFFFEPPGVKTPSVSVQDQ